METWETIRLRCRRDKEQIKPLARGLGLAPNTVRKLRAIAQTSLDQIADLDMAEYDGATILARGEEGLWVPAERFNEDAAFVEDRVPRRCTSDARRGWSSARYNG
jgi:hypothetical protein